MMSLPLLKRKLEAKGYVAFIHERGRLTLSAEESKEYVDMPDYYADLDSGAYIPEPVRELAKSAHGYWEWVNPGELVFVRER